MFVRPVNKIYAIKTPYGEKGKQYDWSIDSQTGYWIPMRDSEGFGNHRGVDFDCGIGTPVHSVSDGFIIRTRYENPINEAEGAGLYLLELLMEPGYDSWVMRYAHLKTIYVRPGAQVVRGQRIAESGDSGDVGRPYLHLDLMPLRGGWVDIQFET